MPHSKFQLYKHIKISGKWRYCRAAIYSNGKVKPHVVVVGAQEEMHEEGSHCIRHKRKSWIEAGTEALEAQRMRSKLVDQTEYTAVQPTAITQGTSLMQASERYFTNLEARGLDAKSIRTYRSGVDPFVQTCKKPCVEDVTKEDTLDFTGWLRKQPLPIRRNANPERTYNNKVGYVAIFLKEFGVSRLLKKKEYPRYHKKKVVAHSEDELSLLYGHANAEERFLLDFFIGSMVRDHEGYGFRYTELTGVTLTIKGKRRKTRTVEISPRLAGEIKSAQTEQLRISLSQLQGKTEPASTSGLAEPRQQSGGEIPHRTTQAAQDWSQKALSQRRGAANAHAGAWARIPCDHAGLPCGRPQGRRSEEGCGGCGVCSKAPSG